MLDPTWMGTDERGWAPTVLFYIYIYMYIYIYIYIYDNLMVTHSDRGPLAAARPPQAVLGSTDGEEQCRLKSR